MKQVALFVLLLTLACAASAQFSDPQEAGVPACGYGVPRTNWGGMAVPNGCGPGLPSATAAAAPTTPCPSTGIYNLGNVCNDIYFIGALK